MGGWRGGDKAGLHIKDKFFGIFSTYQEVKWVLGACQR